MALVFWIFIIPLIASGVLFCFPRRTLAVLMSLIPLMMLVWLATDAVGSSISYNWMPSIGVHFSLRMDSISLLFVYLVAVIIPITLLIVEIAPLILALTLVLQALLFGFFTARDLALFTFFWEAMLIPLFLMMNISGGEKRKKAAMKFLIYMIAGSCLMIAAVLGLYFAVGTFSLDSLSTQSGNIFYAKWILAIFLLAFAVKTPLFPFHGWLPDAYYEASTAGTILLAALLSKAGIYGVYRIGIEIFPTILREWSPMLLAIAIAGVFYGALTAWSQKDFKRLIAYSSLSHVNFILVGLFVWNEAAHSGAILQAINHGITITALFLVVGWLAERLHFTEIGPVSGLAHFLPYLCWLTIFFVMASVALPGTNNFVGELLIFFGVFKENPWLAAFLSLMIILSAMYMLRWVQDVYFEEPSFFQQSWVDISAKEFVIALPLVILILWIGLYPAPILKLIEMRG